jgi:predicted DNA binding CopG/RHH family protein
MKNQILLASEERELLESFESGEWTPVSNKESELIRYSKYAQDTLKKDKRINIRISEKDLDSIQNMAIEEGIPYQTFISSLIHKFVTGKIIERKKVS